MRSIEAILYPNKILISTYYQSKAGYSFVSDKCSWIDVNAPVVEIGKIARKHLQMSQVNVENPTDFSLIQIGYKKATGLHSIKAQMKEAHLVEVTENEGQFNILPTKNGGIAGESKGYHPLKYKEIKIENNISDSQLGGLIKNSWNNCE